MDSGIGLLPAAAAVRRARPDIDLVLSSDPEGLPWGPRTPDDITARALECVRAAAAYEPAALIVACNTASVHALPALRAEMEPAVPVIGTVPAIKPAASAAEGALAIWATPATTGSPYQRRLIEEFGNGADITGVPCHGLADAVESGDEGRIDEAVASAAARTPDGVATVVLGCTHYELVGARIREALRGDRAAGPVLYGSAEAVCAQALRRAGTHPEPGAAHTGRLTVLHNGRESALHEAAYTYAEGRLLAGASAAAPR